ncbi:hypothetical protein BGX21_002327 [Mortierella sp. AD011]|nr:hypothetical protein BGX21_002327 [Mortierella sp. AD011]
MTLNENIDSSTLVDTKRNRSKFSDLIGKVRSGRQSTLKSDSNVEPVKKYSFKNWCGNQQSNPAKIFNPTTLEEIIEIVHLAKANNKIIRCASGCFSLSGSSVVNDEGYLVVVKKMNRMFKPVRVSDNVWTVEFETGVSVKELDYHLRRHDPPLALSSNIAATSLTYGGIITLGCHGARTLADHVHEVKIVDSTGTLNTFSKEKDPHEFSAAALNLGLLGVIYTYTLRVEPMFTLLMRDTSPPLDYYLGSAKIGGPRLKAMVLGNDQTQIFYNPFFSKKDGCEKVWFKEWNRTNLSVVESRAMTKFKRLAELCGLTISNVIYKTVHKKPELTPFLAKTLYNGTSMNKQEILHATEALHFLGGIESVPFCCCEMSIKMDENFENVINAWNFVVEQVREYASRKTYPLNLMLEMRFIRSSPLLMSNVYDDDPEAIFCMIEAVSLAGTVGFDEFMEKIGRYWMENFNAQPHWAKDWEKLPGIYPHIRRHGSARFEQFDVIRRKYDPDNMFMNKTFAGVLAMTQKERFRLLPDFAGKIKNGSQSKPKSEPVKKYSFKNWSGNQRSNPAKIFNPTTLEDLVDIVRQAKANNKAVRCVSGGYSLSGSSVVNEEGYLVVMRKMNNIRKPIHVSGNVWTVEFETGVSVGKLDDYLRRHDPPLTLTSNVAVTSLRYGGVITLGCHGASTSSGTVADHLHEVKIVDSTGTLNTFSREKDPHEFSAAAINLGLLGVVYTYTLQVEPMYTLLMRDTSPPIDGFIECPKIGGARFKTMALGNDQVQIFYNPFLKSKPGCEKLWIKEWTRTDLPVTECRAVSKLKRRIEKCGLTMCNVMYKMMLKVPSAMSPMAKILYKFMSMNKEEVLQASEAMHYLGGVEKMPFRCCEVAFKMDEDFENVSKALKFVIDQIRECAKKNTYPVNIMLEMRFIKSSQLLMANVHDDDPEAFFCTLELISIAGTEGYDEFMGKIAKYWMDNFNAQPHWAKDWEGLPGIYPHIRKHAGARFEKFDVIRRKYDPEDMFMNKTFAGVFSH